MATEVVSREAQREFPRWPVSATKPVRVDLGPAGSGQIVDISAGGIRVKMVAPLRRDAEIPVRIEIPDQSTPVQCSGVVVWSKPNGAAGIRFAKLTDEHKTVLNTWLSALEQAASESSPQRDEFARITAQITAMKLNNADALSLIARRASQLGNAKSIVIALGKPENMICLARFGDAPELGTAIRPTSGLIGECVRSRRLVLVHDASTDPRATELTQGAALILPLLVNTEFRGVMQVICSQTHAFDTKTMELLQKLADAVIFVTHNVMPQRRIATVTALKPSATSFTPLATPRASAPSVPAISKPSDSGRMPAFSAPPATSPSDSGRLSAYTVPLKRVTPFAPSVPSGTEATHLTSLSPGSERPSSIEIAPIAEAVQAPTATAIATRPAFEVVRPLTPTSLRVPAEPLPAFQPRSQSSSKVAVIAVIAVLLVAVPVGFYFVHHRQQQPVAVASVPTPTAAPLPASNPSENTVTVAPETKPTPVTNTSVATATPVTKSPASEASHVATEKPSPEKKAPSVAPVVPEPAPMVLASGRPVERPNIDVTESAAPSATQLAIHATPSIPGISLPAPTSAPKLTAPVAKTWTGGNLLQRVPPIYPQAAITRGLEGPVQLLVEVTARGTVNKVRTVSGNPILAQSAVEAVKRWRYEPFKADGQPVDKEVSITLNFKIPQ